MLNTIRVIDIMSRNVLSCSPSTPLQDLCVQMTQKKYTGVVVKTENDDCAGIVSQGDILAACAREQDLSQCTAGEVMSSPVSSIADSTSLQQAMESFHDGHIKRMAVKDQSGSFIGVVTQTDLVNAAYEKLLHYTDDLEEEVKQRTRELIEMSNLKDEFMGTAAHDLRSPLTAVRMWAELIQDKCLTDSEDSMLADGIEAILEQTANMLQLINNLLDINKIEDGRVNWNMTTVNIIEAMEDSLRLQHEIADKKGIKLESEMTPPLPPIEGDPERLHSVIENLLSNAVKYSSEGDTVTVRAFSEDNCIRIDVEDTGQGIADNEIKKLFSKFSRASSIPTGGEQSTGLGLAIVKKVVEHHGGKVWVESEVEKGSTFSVSLPVN